jgi:hypothetical protein
MEHFFQMLPTKPFILANSTIVLYHVELEWVRGHDGNTGNDAADAGVRLAGERNWRGAEPWGPAPMSWVKRHLGEIMESKWDQEWEERTNCRQTKLMMNCPSLSTWNSLEGEDRAALRRWTGFVTGHTHMRRHLSIVRMDGDDTDKRCRLCEEGEETPNHMLMCPALDLERLQYVALRAIVTMKDALFFYIDSVWKRLLSRNERNTPPPM